MTATLSIQSLVKTYGDFSLGPVVLDLEPGTVLGFVGPNGSGKTTFLKAELDYTKAALAFGHVQCDLRAAAVLPGVATWAGCASDLQRGKCAACCETAGGQMSSGSWILQKLT